MTPVLPVGTPVPTDGALPPAALRELEGRAFGVYVHVPFCRVRCGYCDFNTYTLGELGSGDSAVGLATYAEVAGREIDLAGAALAPGAPGLVSTVFLGGGTPTMLAPSSLVGMLARLRDTWGLADDVEVTTEANPDTITPQVARALADGGFTRVSLGMQSAVPHVLATLDRTHDPAYVERALRACREAGLGVSLDLIYGTPGESLADWRTSLAAAVELEPDHVSAYALTVEDGTALAARVRRGELPAPTDDDEADKYELADEVLAAAGYSWYEISNWARTPDDRCRHNIAYWDGSPWWGIGPGAHSHVGGVRWWNVKHPAAYAGRLAQGVSPGAGREVLTDDQRVEERVLLGVRTRDGLPVDEIPAPDAAAVVSRLIADGLIEGADAVRARRVVLTRRGRLLADTVVGRLLGL